MSTKTVDYTKVKPEDVLKHKEPTKAYMCPLTANIYGIDFMQFKIRDMVTNKTLFHVKGDPDAPNPTLDLEKLKQIPDEARFIRYDFGPEFLKLKTIGTTLMFRVGPKEVPNFRMIERHYFKGNLVKSFDFAFGFCIPNSINTWEVIYDLPSINDKTAKDMINTPYGTRSDSFYFVNNQLIMHNKAEYSYGPIED